MASSADFGQSRQSWIYDDHAFGHAMLFFQQDPVEDSTFYSGPLPVGDAGILSVYRSEDAGNSWHPMFSPDSLMEWDPYVTGLARLADGSLLAVSATSVQPDGEQQAWEPRLFRRGGATGAWTTWLPEIPPPHHPFDVVVEPVEPNRIWLSTVDEFITNLGLYTSEDQGFSWQRNGSGLPADLNRVYPTVLPDQSAWLGTTGYGLFRWQEDSWTPEDLTLDVGRGMVFNVGQECIVARGIDDRRLTTYPFAEEGWDEITLPVPTEGTLRVPMAAVLPGVEEWRALAVTVDTAPGLTTRLDVLSSMDAGQTWQVESQLDFRLRDLRVWLLRSSTATSERSWCCNETGSGQTPTGRFRYPWTPVEPGNTRCFAKQPTGAALR